MTPDPTPGRSTPERPRTPDLPRGTHEWVSFPDPDEDRTWMFDVTFLESNWTCIYGQGCQGVLTGPAAERNEGCCSYGAHLTGRDDRRRVQAAAESLSPDEWQFHDAARSAKGKLKVVEHNDDGDLTTRIHEDACIFLNRTGWPGGAGCALHRAALARKQPPLELKPDVCWQLPLRRDDQVAPDGHVTSVVGQWDRRHWGSGGFEFHWWCTEDAAAFVGTRPVHREMRDELRALVGAKILRRLERFLDARVTSTRPANGQHGSTAPAGVRVRHPALRSR